MSPAARGSALVVLALAIAGLCLWYFARLLAASANPVWYLLPGLGFALAYVLGRTGLDVRGRR